MNKKQVEEYLKDNPFKQLGDVVFNLIEDEIISLKLQPGTKLSISKISEELDISRTPVREALLKLTNTGMVHKQPEGYIIAEMVTRDIEKIYLIRSMIEGKAAYLCAKQNRCPNINKLKELAGSFNQPYEFEKVSSIDFQFHNLILLSSGNEYLLEISKSIQNKFLRIQKSNIKSLIKSNPHAIQKLIAEHNSIINYIRLNLPEMAEREMISHLTGGLNDSLLYSQVSFDINLK